MNRLSFLRTTLLACGLVVCAASVQAQQSYAPADASQGYDASQPAQDAQLPGRVARLAYSSGDLQFAPAGENDWGGVDVNRPMVIGDRLVTGSDGRAVLELGDASVRIDHDSAFDFLNLDEGNVQIELSQGTLNLAVRQLDQGANFEVDTPTVAFVATTPGVYRIDNSPDGTGSMVTVFQGAGTVYGENGASRNVAAGSTYRFDDSTLARVDVAGLPQADDFDQFCDSRDQSYRRYAEQSRQYVPTDMIGGDDLQEYGSWSDVPEYGAVWYPRSVPAQWAPYRYGHWAWIEPWGWTWVDDQRWGFAPFHYGRWAHIGNRWGWLPGPTNMRPVYAPALVAFVGGSGFSVSVNLGGGSPVAWFPLGPRDVYVPWFHSSRHYFTQVNVTNIRRVYVNNTVINNYYVDYSHGRAPRPTGRDYAYRTLPGAVTAVPRSVFTGARPVHQAALRLDRNQLARTQVAMRPGVVPGRASLALRPSAHPAVLKGRAAFQRPVIARHAPPPRPVSFAAREKVIASQGGQPLTPVQLQRLRGERPAAAGSERVKLVAPRGGASAGAAGRPANIARPAEAERGQRPPASTDHAFHNQIHPIPATNQPQPLRPGELRSSRFRQPPQSANPPKGTSAPAGERPRANMQTQEQQRETQAQRAAQLQAQERARMPRAPQQRETASPEQSSAQQMERQRAEQQDQARAAQEQRNAQQQQRQAQMVQQREAQQREAQQRETQQRQQQMEQQRQAQMVQQREAQQRETQQRQQQMEQQRQTQMAQQREAQQREAQQQQRQQQMEQQRQAQMAQQREAQQREAQQQRQQQMEQQRQAQMAQQNAARQQRAMQAEQRAAQEREQRSQEHPRSDHSDRRRPPPSSDDGGH